MGITLKDYFDNTLTWADLCRYKVKNVQYAERGEIIKYEQEMCDIFYPEEIYPYIDVVVKHLEYGFSLNNYNKDALYDSLILDINENRYKLISDIDVIPEEQKAMITFFDNSRQLVDIQEYILIWRKYNLDDHPKWRF